jgi:predicted metal-dependent hydrolase
LNEAGSSDFDRGLALFNGGFYWEAHEAWERLWHALGRRGNEANLVKALIKIAAAGVKVRQGQPWGVSTHSRRALELVRSLRSSAGDRLLGLDLAVLESNLRGVAENPPVDAEGIGARVVRVFRFTLDARSK